MILANNMAAITIMNEATRSVKSSTKATKQFALGERVTDAGDDASAYAISEKMRTKVKSLEQANDNSEKGQNLIDIASSAVDQQVNIMKLVKTLAMKATDDTYNDSDRKVLQKEVSQMLDQSETIARTTTFNGIQLLDQGYVSSTYTFLDITTPPMVNDPYLPVISSADIAPTYTYDVPKGEYVDLSSTTVYYPDKYTAGTGYTSPPPDGTLVWDKDRKVMGHFSRGAGAGEYYVDGNKVTINPARPTVSTVTRIAHQTIPTPIAVGTKITDIKTPTWDADEADTSPIYDTVIAPGTTGSSATAYFKPGGTKSTAELDISKMTVPTPVSDIDILNNLGFSVDCGSGNSYVTFKFNSESNESTLLKGDDTPTTLCYRIGVKDIPTTDSSAFQKGLMEAIFNGIASTNDMGEGLLPGNTTTTITSAPLVQLNYTTAGKLTVTADGPNIALFNGTKGSLVEDDYFTPEQNLSLQTSDSSSNFNNVVLPNTTLSVLFPSNTSHWDIDIKEEDYPEKFPSDYDGLTLAEKKERYRAEIWKYAQKGSALDQYDCVTTRAKANIFLARVDEAIKYLLNSNTTLGAQSSKLDYTMDNLTTITENTNAADSVLRDADMAKTHTTLAKSNLLLQAAQSMLAQANQNSKTALELLQA